MTQLIVTSLSTPELINFIDTSLEITTVHPRQLLPPELHAAQVIFIIETTFEQQLSTYQSLVLRPNQIVFIVLMPDQLKDFATIHRTFAVELCATIDYLIAPLTPEKRDIRVCVWEQAQQSKRPILKIQDLLLNFFHSLPEIAWFKDQHLNYLSVNQAFLNLYGKTSAEIIGKSDEQIWAEPLPINAGDSDQEILKTHEAQTFSAIFPTHTNSVFFQVHKMPIFDINDQFCGIFGFAQDFSSLKTTQNELQITLDSLPMGACIRDIHGNLICFNAIFGLFYEQPLALGDNIFDPKITPSALEREFIRAKDQYVIQSGKPLIYQNTITIDGSARIIEFTKSPIFDLDGTIIQILLLLRDITETVEQEERIRRLAFNDPLTGLANRSGLYEMMTHTHPEKTFGAIFLIDIINFKRYNEQFGHDFGNLLLKEYGRRLAALRPDDFISRDSDEFTIFATFATEPTAQQLWHDATELFEALQLPITLGDSSYIADLRIGFALAPLDKNFMQTIDQCELALTIAKEQIDEKIVAYSLALVEQKQLHDQFFFEFEQALLNHEIELFYQPQYTCQNKLIGFEALFRWPNNNFPQFNVGQIIELVEKTPLIHQLGIYSLQKAMNFAALINQNRTEHLTVAINLSAYQVMAPNFVKIIETFLNHYRVQPHMIDLEITETILLEDFDANIAKFAHLKAQGFKISLDDFGTGYSSLNYLANLPLSTVKIDRSFICELTRQAKYQTLVKLIVDAAHALDLEVVAEGVETQAELSILDHMDADYIQGFYFSKPLSEQAAYALIH